MADIAQEYGVSVAQAAALGPQRNTAVIPKTSKPERLKNLDRRTSRFLRRRFLNQNWRFNDPGVFCADAFNTFHAFD